MSDIAGNATAVQMYRSLVGLGVVCSLAVAAVYLLTQPVIERNRARALDAAISRLFPEAQTRQAFVLMEEGVFRLTQNGGEGIYAVFDAGQALIGFALPAQGMGYQDRIGVLYGYDPVRQAIVGLEVLESRETPGLGDRIRHDADFHANFEHLDVRLRSDGAALSHALEVVRPGKKKQPWQIDGITGATVSSVAIGDILNNSAGRWLPSIQARLEDFNYGAQTH